MFTFNLVKTSLALTLANRSAWVTSRLLRSAFLASPPQVGMNMMPAYEPMLTLEDERTVVAHFLTDEKIVNALGEERVKALRDGTPWRLVMSGEGIATRISDLLGQFMEQASRHPGAVHMGHAHKDPAGVEDAFENLILAEFPEGVQDTKPDQPMDVTVQQVKVGVDAVLASARDEHPDAGLTWSWSDPEQIEGAPGVQFMMSVRIEMPDWDKVPAEDVRNTLQRIGQGVFSILSTARETSLAVGIASNAPRRFV